MHGQAGPLSYTLPGERHITEYRRGALTLTNRRVVYRRKGPDRDDFQSLSLSKVGMVGFTRRRQFQFWLLLIPVSLFVVGFVLSAISGDPGPLFRLSFIALPTVVLPWVGRSLLAIHVATPEHRIEALVPKRHRVEALDFVRAVEAARFSDPGAEDPASTRVPTTHAFQG